MCFIKHSKSSAAAVAASTKKEEVVRHEADASITKNPGQALSSGYRENLKTSPIGLTEDAKINKKTLLGE